MPEFDGWPEGAKKTFQNLRRNIEEHKKLDGLARTKFLDKLDQIGGTAFNGTDLDDLSKAVATSIGGTYYCSFCGKTQYEVSRVIAGPGVCICDECVDLLTNVLREDGHNAALRPSLQISPADLFSASGLLSHVANYLNIKYPGEEVTVSILQTENLAKMTIESASGSFEVEEKALDELG